MPGKRMAVLEKGKPVARRGRKATDLLEGGSRAAERRALIDRSILFLTPMKATHVLSRVIQESSGTYAGILERSAHRNGETHLWRRPSLRARTRSSAGQLSCSRLH